MHLYAPWNRVSNLRHEAIHTYNQMGLLYGCKKETCICIKIWSLVISVEPRPFYCRRRSLWTPLDEGLGLSSMAGLDAVAKRQICAPAETRTPIVLSRSSYPSLYTHLGMRFSLYVLKFVYIIWYIECPWSKAMAMRIMHQWLLRNVTYPNLVTRCQIDFRPYSSRFRWERILTFVVVNNKWTGMSLATSMTRLQGPFYLLTMCTEDNLPENKSVGGWSWPLTFM
jgi:hypothetical protein